MAEKQVTEELYKKFEDFTIELCVRENTDILVCAGIMMAQALRIYKTTLSEHEFELMTAAILSSRDRVQELKSPPLH
tara:strand:- start:175 stop:405 length:231 start_codon:yes stop_codon:yes gene_type:complete